MNGVAENSKTFFSAVELSQWLLQNNLFQLHRGRFVVCLKFLHIFRCFYCCCCCCCSCYFHVGFQQNYAIWLRMHWENASVSNKLATLHEILNECWLLFHNKTTNTVNFHLNWHRLANECQPWIAHTLTLAIEITCSTIMVDAKNNGRNGIGVEFCNYWQSNR